MPAESSADELDDKSLQAGLDELGLAHEARLEGKLRSYMALLEKWSRTYNLVSPASQPDMLARHVLDSLVAGPYLHGERVLDVGTGAGLPGMVLALAQPGRHFTLLDANAKKIRFCRQVCAELSIGNVEVVHSRVQNFRAPLTFSCVLSRAYGTVGQLLDQTSHLCEPKARLLVLKGAKFARELDALGPIRDNTRVVKLRVPGLEAQRHLVIVDVPEGPKCPK